MPDENPADTRADLGMLERLRFEVAGEQFEGRRRTTATDVDDSELWVVVQTENDRCSAGETQWANGSVIRTAGRR